jgi:hypothetical protein
MIAVLGLCASPRPQPVCYHKLVSVDSCDTEGKVMKPEQRPGLGH